MYIWKENCHSFKKDSLPYSLYSYKIALVYIKLRSNMYPVWKTKKVAIVTQLGSTATSCTIGFIMPSVANKLLLPFIYFSFLLPLMPSGRLQTQPTVGSVYLPAVILPEASYQLKSIFRGSSCHHNLTYIFYLNDMINYKIEYQLKTILLTFNTNSIENSRILLPDKSGRITSDRSQIYKYLV